MRPPVEFPMDYCSGCHPSIAITFEQDKSRMNSSMICFVSCPPWSASALVVSEIHERMTTNPFVVFISILTVGLAACSKKEDAKVATQVAARVNSADITVHQINHALARSRGVTADNASQAKREMLDRLIDQELAKRQAILKGLDRSPSVILDMEAAKSEILARAYRESLVD